MAYQSIANSRGIPGASLPFAFIVLWSTGYIGGAVGLAYAEPFTMTFLRFVLAGALLLLVAAATRAPWPSSRREAGHIVVVALLVQVVQFGGLYSGMNAGVPAGVSALIVGLMPVLTALGASRFLGERVSWRQWCGLGLGLAGVVAVVGDRITAGGSVGGFLLVGLALFGITAGTLYQKKFCSEMDLRTGGFIQMVVGAAVLFVLARGTETMEVRWTAGFVGSLTWLAVVNSIGAASLLLVLIRRGEATRVASLFYLIPPVTAVMASAVLAEMPDATTLVGFALAAAGVHLGTRR